AVLVVGWPWLRHGQRPRRLTVVGAAAAIAGLAMVLDLGGSARIDPVGVMWGLLAAAGLPDHFLLGGGTDGEAPTAVRQAWGRGGMWVGAVAVAGLGGIGVLPVAATTGDVGFLGHRVSWAVPVLGLSLVAAVIAYVAGIGAARRLGAKLASFIGMAEVLFAILVAWLLLGQLPSVVQFLGGAFILGGVTLVRIDELKASPAALRPDSPARVSAARRPGRTVKGEPA